MHAASIHTARTALPHGVHPAYFGGYMNANFLATFEALPQLGAREAYQLARNSFEASFVAPEVRERWTASLDAAFAAA